jgi:hypothetical protein
VLEHKSKGKIKIKAKKNDKGWFIASLEDNNNNRITFELFLRSADLVLPSLMNNLQWNDCSMVK